MTPLLLPDADGDMRLTCSARGCRGEADWGLRWNNPRLHTPERRKTWLACDLHRADLESYLGSRGFLRETLPVDDLPDRLGRADTPGAGADGSAPQASDGASPQASDGTGPEASGRPGPGS